MKYVLKNSVSQLEYIRCISSYSTKLNDKGFFLKDCCYLDQKRMERLFVELSDLNVVSTSTNIENYDSDGIPKSLVTWVFDPETFILSAKLTKHGKYNIITDHLGTPVEAYDRRK